MPRHAPKGKIKGPPAELDRTDTEHHTDALAYVSCSATAKGSGRRCKRRPIPGGNVCVKHGGGAPQVQAKAMDRLRALQHPAIDTMAYLMGQRATFPSTAYAAARDVLDRTEGKAAETVRQEHSGELVIKWQGEG